MLGFKWGSISKPPSILHQFNKFHSHFIFKSKTHYKLASKFILFAQNSNHDRIKNNKKNITKEESNPNSIGKDQQKNQKGSVNDGDDDVEKDRRPVFNIKWGDLFNPDPDNVLAVGLAGLLTWASVQVLWQLLLISLAILLAALKYTFIAALLLLILITLL